MRWAEVVLGLAACAKPSPEPGVPPPPPASTAVSSEAVSVEPSASQRALYDALKGRDGSPSCSELAAFSPTLGADLVWLSEHVSQPAYLGVRAAQCVVTEHAEAEADALRRWVVSPETVGFGRLVWGALDTLPEALAVELATLAVTEGPEPEAARARVMAVERPAVRAVGSAAQKP